MFQPLAAVALGILLSVALATGAPPLWWAERGAVRADLPANDHAAATVGQLKHFTARAVDELNAKLPGGAGEDLNALVQQWRTAHQTGGYSATNPNPADHVTVTDGQLKWIASRLHARLVAEGVTPSLPAWLQPNPAAANQIVNLGQLKTVFAVNVPGRPRPPHVDAGPNATAVVGGALTLQGAVLPATGSTIAWRKESGPGTVSFAQPGSPQTPITFSVPGEYVLRLSAANETAVRSDLVLVNVGAAALNRTIALTSPSDRSVVPAGGTVTLAAQVAGGAVDKVVFYAGNRVIGEDLSAPYSLAWKPTRNLLYRLTARAIVGTGAVISAPRMVTVGADGAVNPDTWTGNNGGGGSSGGSGRSGPGGQEPDPTEDPFGDDDEDGLTNEEEDRYGTDKGAEDTDGDNVNDLEDGWARFGPHFGAPPFAPARLPDVRYALVLIGPDHSQVEAANTVGDVVYKVVDGGSFQRYKWTSEATSNLPSQGSIIDFSDDGYLILQTNGSGLGQTRAVARDSQIYHLQLFQDFTYPPFRPYFIEATALLRGGQVLGATGFDFTDGGTFLTNRVHSAASWNPNGTPKGRLGDVWGYLEFEGAAGYPEEYVRSVIPSWQFIRNNYRMMLFRKQDEDANTVISSGTHLSFVDANLDLAIGSMNTAAPGAYSIAGWNWREEEDGSYEGVDGIGISEGFSAEQGMWWNGAPHPLQGTPKSITSQNHITGLSLNGSRRVLWLDSTTGLRNDQPTTSQPQYAQTVWSKEHGDLLPMQLNARMEGVGWRNGLAFDINEFIDGFSGPEPKWKLEGSSGGIAISDQGLIAATVTRLRQDNGTPIPSNQQKSRAALLVPVELYRDRSSDKSNRVKLDDWPETQSKVRSPRHLLAKEDTIYIRLPGLSGGNYKVKVTSESDSSGVTLDLSEVDGGLENQSENRLRLSDTTGSAGGAKTLKVIDEEVLNFSLIVNGQDSGVFAEVMVDRAEFASGGIDGFYQGAGGDRSVVRDKLLTDYKFFENGDLQLPGNSTSNPAATKAFLKNAGSNGANSKQADIVHFSSHGNAAGKLFDHSPNANMLFDPTSDVTAGTTWNEDVEWVILASCSQLNEASGGRAAWENAIKGSNRPAHGILGAYEPLSANLQSVYESFWGFLNDEQIGPHLTIPQAYSIAMESGGQPWAMVYHTANELDMLREYKRDETGSTTFTYLTGISGFNFTCGRGLEEYKSDKDLPLGDGVGVARFKIDEMAKHVRVTRNRIELRSVSESGAALSKEKGFIKIGQGRAVDIRNAALNKRSHLSPSDATKLADRTVQQAFQVKGADIREIRVAERRRVDVRGNTVNESSTGYLVQYGVYVDEVPVWDAYINVSIFENNVGSVGYKVVEKEQADDASVIEQPVKDIKTALDRAIPGIKRIAEIKGKYSIDMAELCYVSKGKFGGSSDEYIPVWHAVLNLAPEEKVCAKRHVWIDAYSGELLGIER